METFAALLALCAGNSPVTGEFPSQWPVTRSFDVIFDLRLDKRLSKQSTHQWFETSSRSLRRHCNAYFHMPLAVHIVCMMIDICMIYSVVYCIYWISRTRLFFMFALIFHDLIHFNKHGYLVLRLIKKTFIWTVNLTVIKANVRPTTLRICVFLSRAEIKLRRRVHLARSVRTLRGFCVFVAVWYRMVCPCVSTLPRIIANLKIRMTKSHRSTRDY